MANKLFHVFISSTYADLQEERQRISEALSKAGHVPEGMELFPASSQKQFDFIKRIIDRCDYYVIVLAGRYGSTLPDGKSFTQLEYEYALQKELPTLAFLRSDLNQLTVAKVEADAEKSRRLDELRKRIEQSSLVDYWTAPDQLATKVVAAIAQEGAANPGIGWIRGDRAASDELLNEINDLRKVNDELRSALAQAQPRISVPNLAKLTDTFEIHYEYKTNRSDLKRSSTIKLTWQEILAIVGPGLRTTSNTSAVHTALDSYLKDVARHSYSFVSFSTTDKKRILNQLELLGYVKGTIYNLQGGGQGLFYQLTSNGVAEVVRLNAVVSNTLENTESVERIGEA